MKICEREWKWRAKENIYHWSVAPVLLSIVSCVSVNCGWNDCRLLSSPHNKGCRTIGKMRKFLTFAPLPSLNWLLVAVRCRCMYIFLCMSLKINFHLLGVVFHRHEKKTLLFISLMLYLAKSSHRAAKKWVNWITLRSHQRARSLKNIFHSVFSLFSPVDERNKKNPPNHREQQKKIWQLCRTRTTMEIPPVQKHNRKFTERRVRIIERKSCGKTRIKYQNVLGDTLRVSWRRVRKEIAMFIEWNLFIVQHLSLICRKSSFAASFHCFVGLRASAPSFSTTFVIVGVFSPAHPRPLSTQFYEWTRTPLSQLKIMRMYNIPSRCWLNITCDGSRWC